MQKIPVLLALRAENPPLNEKAEVAGDFRRHVTSR